MKVLILAITMFFCIDSYCQYNFYFGNLHAHTSYSDGNKDSMTTGYKTPGDAYNYAKSSYQMDFLGIAEHNHYSANNNPGMRVADYSKGLYQADTANKDGQFICMYGMEWGVISNGGHIVTYGVPALIGWETGSGAWGNSNNYDVYCAKNDYDSYWRIVNSYPNSFCTLAHPQTGDYNDLLGNAPFSASADSVLVGCALRSGSAFSTTTDYSDGPSGWYGNRYFSGLARGYHIGPVADQDNHYTTFGRTNKMRTVVLATSLTRTNIINAYKARRFYASDDWNVKVNFTVNGNYMGSNFFTSDNSNINISINDPDAPGAAGDNTSAIQLFYGIPGSGINPAILTSNTNSNSLSYVHSTTFNDSFYYVAKITQADGDTIWTAPIWVQRTSPVAVHIHGFSGKQQEPGVLLKWSAYLSSQQCRFEIERSSGDLGFSVIGSVQPDRQGQTEFTFTDRNATNGLHFYRIRLIEPDGKISYSETIALEVSKPAIIFTSIHPNPVKDFLRIHCTSDNNYTTLIRIYDNEGREIKRFNTILTKGANSIQINAGNYLSGLYHLVISNNSGRLAETSFIKQ